MQSILFTAPDWETMDPMFRRNFFNTLSGFKSVALIATKSKAGISNLALFSQILHIGANPPLIGILFRPHTVKRDTFENILETGHFTLNQIQPEILEKAHHTSARWEGSEFEGVGLKEEYLNDFESPFVKESYVKIACTLADRLDVQINGTILLIGKIEKVILPKEIIKDDGFLDLESANSICSLGLDSYHTTNSLGRFAYSKPDKLPKKLH
jgi:flavin reductase (DIM6/NTAB) family NADH-FMN oxidoreductase RutF